MSFPKINTIMPGEGSATGGVPVRITGSLLQHVQHVTFGTIAVPPTTATPTAVTCLSPPGPEGPVQVSVTDDEGNKSNSLRFIYTVPPGVEIRSG